MEKTYSQSEHNNLVVEEVRKAIEHRATWMYLLLKEARERGLAWDDFGRAAVRKTGSIHGLLKKGKMKDPTSMEEFQTVFAGQTSRGVFEMDVVKADEDSYHLDFHYCPLVTAWEKLGATPEEIEQLCDIAMDGDRGVAGEFEDFEFSLGKTMANGDEVCEIRFDRVKRRE